MALYDLFEFVSLVNVVIRKLLEKTKFRGRHMFESMSTNHVSLLPLLPLHLLRHLDQGLN